MRGFDADVRQHIATALSARGIILHPGTTIDLVTDDASKKIKRLSTGDTLTADTIMAATGRHPNTAGLGLDAVGVSCGDRGRNYRQ